MAAQRSPSQKGKIILLNGVSSSGKTTLGKALIEKLPDFFYLGIDDFDMLIEHIEDRENGRLIPVETEYFFHKTVAMFSDKGVNLVVDHILHDEFTRQHAITVLVDYPVLFVGVHCPLDELEKRERSRADRHPGQARQQLEFVHRNEVYDVEVDTAAESSELCADRIVAFLNSSALPKGWLETSSR
jgi:chloramphenicol 3-O phosphotransferase